MAPGDMLRGTAATAGRFVGHKQFARITCQCSQLSQAAPLRHALPTMADTYRELWLGGPSR